MFYVCKKTMVWYILNELYGRNQELELNFPVLMKTIRHSFLIPILSKTLKFSTP